MKAKFGLVIKWQASRLSSKIGKMRCAEMARGNISTFNAYHFNPFLAALSSVLPASDWSIILAGFVSTL